MLTRPVNASTAITYAREPGAATAKRAPLDIPCGRNVTRGGGGSASRRSHRETARLATTGGLSMVPGPTHDERVSVVVDEHLEGFLAGHRPLARRAEEGGDRSHLRPGPHAIGGAAHGGRDHRRADGEHREDHHQLNEGEAARHLVSQEVTSLFSPSPPGAPSAPRVQMS